MYGASSSGYYAIEAAKLQNYKIIFILDRQPQNKYHNISDQIPIYKDIQAVPKQLKTSVELVLIALGNEQSAEQQKLELARDFDCTIQTVHEAPYLSLYEPFKAAQSRLAYLEEEGYYRSAAENQSVDKEGNAIPWLNYSMIHFLKTRVPYGLTIFEYGAGHSTLWWSTRAKRLITVEHDREWYKYILGKIDKNNTELFHKELDYNGEYSKTINKYDNIDIVFIDGRDRVNCAKQATKRINDTGVIIWDNTDRAEYNEGYEYLQEKGFKRLDFKGIASLTNEACCTSVFYRAENCLGL